VEHESGEASRRPRPERKPKAELQVRSHLAALMAVLPSVSRSAAEWQKAKTFATRIARHKRATIGEKIMAHKTLVQMLMHEHKVAQYVDQQQQTAGVPITADIESGGMTFNGVTMMVNKVIIVRDSPPMLPPPPPPSPIEEPDDGQDGDGD
jgi:hypothetical protein